MSLYAANAIGAVVVGHSVRDALYLANRPARGLAGMYIWSSIAIVLVSWFYARIADRLPRGLLNAASAIGCAALGAALWAILTVTDAVWVYAALYVFVEAMGSLVVIQFWTLANEVFHALNGKQRDAALLGDPREEKGTDTVALKKRGERIPGLPVSEMTRDQKELVEKVLGDLLQPFRKQDADEAMKYIRGNGGMDGLTMSFYKNLDIGNDGVWDVWQLESPNMLWYFRGAPHVHTWVNVRA